MNPILHLDVTADGRTRTFTFDTFPVRIGRDESSDCELAFSFVSRLHATIHLRDGALVLRDEGSRNGVYVGGVKLEPRECVDLRVVGNEFEIMTVRLKATLRDEVGTATVIDAEPAAANATRHYADASINPMTVDAHGVVLQVRTAYERYRDAWEEIERALKTSVETLAPDRRAAIMKHLAIEFAQLAREPEFRALASRYGVVLDADRPPSGPTEADVALRGLRELAAAYVPYGPPLASNEAVAGFLEKLESAFDVLFEGFVALRFAHRSETGQTLESVPSADEIAARLLDWTASGHAGRDEVEEAFIEMITHHARLVADVGEGTRKLLMELSPDAIDAATPRGFLALGRCRRLWTAFRYRYSRLTSADAPMLGGTFERVEASLYPKLVAAVPADESEQAHALLPSAVSA